MRLSLLAIAAAATAASLLATTAIAGAQPAAAESGADGTATAAITTSYLEPGVEVGVTQGGLFGAVRLDGGFRLGDTPLWLHGRFAQGAMAAIEDRTMTSDFTELRAGLEARGCALSGIVCLVGGVDFGYRHQMLDTDRERQTADLGLAVGRVGLDLGGQHLRLRPSIETGVDQAGWNGIGLTAGIAYTW